MSLPNSPGINGLSNTPLIPFTDEDRSKFARIFNNCNPQNGDLDGETARDLLMKSKLPIDVLGQIWNLADTQNRGRLDQVEFSIAMYFVQNFMNGNIKVMPTQLPPELLDAARGTKVSLPSREMSNVANRSTIFTGDHSSTGLSRSGSTNFHTAYSSTRTSDTDRKSTSLTSSPYISHSTVDEEWVIKTEEKARFDRLFATIDKASRGYITGEEAVPYFSRSKLSEATLAQIWDLADISQNGQLNRDEFAVSLYLIQMKLSGKDLPAVLPRSFIPPTMRKPLAGYGSNIPGIPSSSQGSVQLTSSLDLHKPTLDFFSSSSTQDQSAKSGNTNTSTNSLTSTPILGTAEVQNHITRTTTANNEREQLEHSLANATSQKKDLDNRYSQVKALYDAELSVIQGLQDSLRKENEELQNKRKELNKIEQEYSQLQLQKNILQEEMDKDMKESNEIKQKIKHLNEEIQRLKVDNERMVKENKQQKNLLQVNRGQLASVTSEKQRLEGSNDEQKMGSFTRSSPNMNSKFGIISSPNSTENVQNNHFNLNKSNTQNFPLSTEGFKKSPKSHFPSSTSAGVSNDRNSSTSFHNIFPSVSLMGNKENPFSIESSNSSPSSTSFSASQPQSQTKSQSHSPLSFDNPMFWKSSKTPNDNSSNFFFPKAANDSDERETPSEEKRKINQLQTRLEPGFTSYENDEELELDMNKAQIISPKNQSKPYSPPVTRIKGLESNERKDKGADISIAQSNNKAEQKSTDAFSNLKASKIGGLDESLLEFDTAFNGNFGTDFNPSTDTSTVKPAFDDPDFNTKFPTTDKISNDTEFTFSTKPSELVTSHQPAQQGNFSAFDFEHFSGKDSKAPTKNDLNDIFGGAANMSNKTSSVVFDDIFGDAFPTTTPSANAIPPTSVAATSGFDDIFGVNQPKPAQFDTFGASHSTPNVSIKANNRPGLEETSPITYSQDSPHSSSLRELMGMGFTQEQAQMALERYDNDLNKATNFLLDQ